MVTPNFFIVGAIKSGTTALYHYLGQHPDVRLSSRQEPNFFAFMGEQVDFRGPGGVAAPINRTSVTEPDDYDALYASGRGTCIGDISPVYLCWPTAATNIASYAPEAKIVMVLRNPVERAFSSYTHLLRDQAEPLPTFRQALLAEPGRVRDHWGFLWRYISVGRYAAQVERYMGHFPSEQLLILLYDDLKADAARVVSEIQQFIGVDDRFTADVRARYNVTGLPRSRTLHKLLSRQHVLKRAVKRLTTKGGRQRLQALRARADSRNLVKPELSDDDRNFLVAELGDDVLRLATLIDRPLDHWLTHRSQPQVPGLPSAGHDK